MKADRKIEALKMLGLENKLVQRKLFEFLKSNNLNFDSALLEKFDFKNIMDLLWVTKIDKFDEDFIRQERLLAEIFTARGDLLEAKESAVFALNVLIKLHHLKDSSGDISFSYINCSSRIEDDVDFYSVASTLTKNVYKTLRHRSFCKGIGFKCNRFFCFAHGIEHRRKKRVSIHKGYNLISGNPRSI